MIRLKWTGLLLICFSFHSVQSQNASFLKADGKWIADGRGKHIQLRGIGLGGWMIQEGYMLHLNHEGQQYRIRQRIEAIVGKAHTDEFYAAWLSNQTSRSDMDSLHAWGFNSVRLPMHYNLFTVPVDDELVAGKNTWLTTGFALTDSLVAWCKANHIYVFLDLHAAPGGQGNDLNISDRNPSRPSLWQSEADKQKTIALWRTIAERYASDTTIGGYDILNEPNWGFEDTAGDRNGLKEQKNQPLKQLLTDITKAIREVDQNHLIVIEGNGWGNNYHGMLPAWDNNMVLSFHKYWNNNDQQSIQHILNFRDQYNIPVWLGETGENSNVWFTDAIRLFETNQIGWSWWPLKKLGNNNPLQIRSNGIYDSLADYWNGKIKTAPTPENAYHGLMELARQAKCENNIVHRDVIDAMIRQPFSIETKPFGPNLVGSGSVIAAVDYDLGVNGAAYYDKDTGNYYISTGKQSAGNRGRVYRNDGVDIYSDSLHRGNYYVGNIEDGEWLQYTIDITREGNYDVALHISCPSENGMISLTDAGFPHSDQVLSFGETKGRHELIFKNFPLKQGIHRLRVSAIKGGFNFYDMTFTYKSHL
jgi:aryl-phospho-beta-D-glucosidase BglC (GH1 family)